MPTREEVIEGLKKIKATRAEAIQEGLADLVKECDRRIKEGRALLAKMNASDKREG